MSSNDVYQELTRVRPPLQGRSRQAQFAALDAFESMLRDRPLHKVTVQDVADMAKLSITSVYARFDGKKALVLALHERVIQEWLRQLVLVLEAANDDSDEVAQTAAAVMTAAVTYSTENAHVFTAVLSASDEETNQRAAGFIRAASRTLADHLVPLLGGDADKAERNIDYAWRSVMAVLQQGWALGDAEPARFPLSADHLAARLTEQFLALIQLSGPA